MQELKAGWKLKTFFNNQDENNQFWHCHYDKKLIAKY